MVEYLSGGRVQGSSLERINNSGNATLNGTSTNSATAINGVGSLDFDGTASDYITFSQALTDELNTTNAGSWTFSCWVYVDDTSSGQHTILSKIVAGYSLPNHELNFRQAGSNWQLHFGTSTSGTNTQAISHTGWTHLILSATNLGTSASVWKFYVDNQASPVTVTGTEDMLWNATTLLLFGRQNKSGSDSERWFDGQAQEIAFWNKELDSSERSALFNSYAHGTATSGSNTGAKANTVATSNNLAYYTLNSSSVTNSSPNPSLGSNHPVNSRYEETDTRKIFRRKDDGYGSGTIETYGDMLSNVGGTLTLETDAPAGLATAGNTKCWKSTSLQIKSRTGMGANTARTFIPNDTDWSFGFWFKSDTWSVGGSNSPGIMSAKSSGGTSYMWFEFNSGPGTPSGDEPKFNVLLYADSPSYIATNCDTGADTGNWHWMLVTYDKSAGTITWYMDNTTSGTGYCTDTQSSETILDLSNIDYYLIGATAEQYQGKLTDICIWNTILTSTQRGNIYGNGGSTAKLSNTESKTDIRVYHDCQSITFPITNKATSPSWVEKGTA